MNIVQKTLRLVITISFISLIEACNTSTPIPASISTALGSVPTLPVSETPNPSTATPVPPTVTPTQVTLTPDPALVAGFEGLWEGSNGSYYVFYLDGTWHWHQILDKVENSPENTGKWWMQGDVFYVVDLTGPGKCPENQVGRYKANIQDTTLKLILVSDKCEVRVKQTAGIYKHLP